MKEQFDLILHGGTIIGTPGDVGVRGGKIAALGDLGSAEARSKIDLKGLTLLPGVIDSQVHFREPGLTHKEDLASGTQSALLGGVTAVFEMPNTKPPTMDAIAMADKVERAKGRTWVHIGFYMGSGVSNALRLADLEYLPGCIGIKVFFGSSTGNLLFNEPELLQRAMATTKRLMSFHCEEEGRLQERAHIKSSRKGQPLGHVEWRDELTAFLATQKVIDLATRAKRRVHILHVTTRQEIEFLRQHRAAATVEVLPQHLTLASPECYERLGNYAQMNPPIRGLEHQAALWQGIKDGTVDVIGSDHAPHTHEEKSLPWPESPSGMPGTQTLLPIMLNHVSEGRLTLAHLVKLFATNPARLAGLTTKGEIRVGADADLTIVDLKREQVIEKKWLASKCGWSPFEGHRVKGWPTMVLLQGTVAMRDGELIGGPQGQIL
jgi:dihydroorotase